MIIPWAILSLEVTCIVDHVTHVTAVSTFSQIFKIQFILRGQKILQIRECSQNKLSASSAAPTAQAARSLGTYTRLVKMSLEKSTFWGVRACTELRILR